MGKLLTRFERYIVLGLLGMMIIVVFLSTVELAIVLVTELIDTPKWLLLDINELLRIFGFFLMTLIGLELIQTMKVYLADDTVHVEIITLVAIIAITRKVIILDVKKMEPLALLGVAAIILALCVGYYLLKKALNQEK